MQRTRLSPQLVRPIFASLERPLIVELLTRIEHCPELASLLFDVAMDRLLVYGPAETKSPSAYVEMDGYGESARRVKGQRLAFCYGPEKLLEFDLTIDDAFQMLVARYGETAREVGFSGEGTSSEDPGLADTLIPLRFEDAPLLWTLPVVLAPAKCAELIARTDSSALARADDLGGFRRVDRAEIFDQQLTDILFDRMKPFLTEKVGCLTLKGLNPLLRLYRYSPGDYFSPHLDHWHVQDDRHLSLHTVLVYLNDDFEGGGTRFMDQRTEHIAPRQGHAVVFQHKIRHEGCTVRSGVKYLLRTDTMYEAPSPIRLPMHDLGYE